MLLLYCYTNNSIIITRRTYILNRKTFIGQNGVTTDGLLEQTALKGDLLVRNAARVHTADVSDSHIRGYAYEDLASWVI